MSRLYRWFCRRVAASDRAAAAICATAEFLAICNGDQAKATEFKRSREAASRSAEKWDRRARRK